MLSESHKTIFHYIEMTFLVLLMSDFLIHFYAFRLLYIQGDLWTLFDVSLISANIIIVAFDIAQISELMQSLDKA
jgi:hypothetical protein